jgi:hypothetical protein
MTGSRLVLGSNFLVLFIVGQDAPTFIPGHRRLRSYTEADYELLTKTLSGFQSVVVTPYALSEVSNLVTYRVSEPLRSHFMLMLAQVACTVTEVFAPSSQVAGAAEFVRLGLADAAWLEGLGPDTVMLTDDQQLYIAAAARGLRAFYFPQVRGFGGMRS